MMIELKRASIIKPPPLLSRISNYLARAYTQLADKLWLPLIRPLNLESLSSNRIKSAARAAEGDAWTSGWGVRATFTARVYAFLRSLRGTTFVAFVK